MTVSLENLSRWLEDQGLTPRGSQSSFDLSSDLLQFLRHESSTQGDARNIHDGLKALTTEEVKEQLRETSSGLVSIFVNLIQDRNLSTGVRNANWFNGENVVIAGRRRWDRRGAVGSQNYLNIDYAPDVLEAIATYRANGYRIVAAEITETAVPLTTYAWEDKSVIIYGEEGAGLSDEVIAEVDDVVFIPGRGSVRSLNVGVTHGIFTYDYSLKRHYI